MFNWMPIFLCTSFPNINKSYIFFSETEIMCCFVLSRTISISPHDKSLYLSTLFIFLEYHRMNNEINRHLVESFSLHLISISIASSCISRIREQRKWAKKISLFEIDGFKYSKYWNVWTAVNFMWNSPINTFNKPIFVELHFQRISFLTIDSNQKSDQFAFSPGVL